jgi:guanylate kinase
MQNIFIVDGASGTGKTDMLKYLLQKQTSGNEAVILCKFTTRKRRPEEQDENYHLDLEFVEEEQFKEYKKQKDFYSYPYGEHQYGFFKSLIEDALKYYKNVFIIIRNNNLAQNLKSDFPKIRFIHVYIYTDIPQVIQRLKKSGYSEDWIDFRLKRQELAWKDYLRYSQNYDEVIINNSNYTDYERLIEQLINKYGKEAVNTLEFSNNEKYNLINHIVGYKAEMLSRLKIYSFDKNIFLMMKFRPENQLLFEFIRDTLVESGYNCIRADQPEWNITKSVYNPIATLYCCKYGIALFDSPEEKNEFNPNVAYELGMMHYQGKECLILLHSSLLKVPFDLVKEIYTKYASELEIKNIIKKWVATLKEK